MIQNLKKKSSSTMPFPSKNENNVHRGRKTTAHACYACINSHQHDIFSI